MQDIPDRELLRRFGQNQSDEAFSELVRRHINLVYSVALRHTDNVHHAQEITQAVFIVLVRKAASLGRETVLSGWLYHTARLTAANFRRAEIGHVRREQEAYVQSTIEESSPDTLWRELAPLLDEAMSHLDSTDRDAVVLRYFQNHDLRAVGAALGISDDAAQKRVSRAVERLREFFTKRGVTVGASGLAVAITANAIQAAPVGLALTISATAALTGTTLVATTTATATKAIVMTTLQKTLVTATIVVAVGTGIYEARQISSLHDENQRLIAQQAQLTNERDAALSATAAKSNELEQLQKGKNDLIRLRGEVGMLRRQIEELEKLRKQNLQLQAALAKFSQPVQEPQTSPDADVHRQAAIAKMNDAKLLVLGLIMYADDNQNQLPANLNQTSNYWANGDHRLTETNQFELVVQGALNSITNPATTIAVREKEASLVNGKFVKAYGFADGHSEYKTEPPEGFEAWEKQHIIPQPGK